MLTKLPPQFIKSLEKGVHKRKEWIKQRMFNIYTTVKQVIKKGNESKSIIDDYTN
jgi:hypothetical protein